MAALPFYWINLNRMFIRRSQNAVPLKLILLDEFNRIFIRLNYKDTVSNTLLDVLRFD